MLKIVLIAKIDFFWVGTYTIINCVLTIQWIQNGLKISGIVDYNALN